MQMTPQASRLPLARRAVGPGVPVPTVFWDFVLVFAGLPRALTLNTHVPSYCLAAPSALNSLPVLRHHLSEQFERPVGVTPGAVTGVSAPHRHARSDVRSLCAQAIYLGLSQAYWVALLARRRPCARYCILLRALGTATAARGLSGPFYAALTLCFGTQAWPHFLGRRWHPFLRALRLGLRPSGVLAQRVRRPHRR